MKKILYLFLIISWSQTIAQVSISTDGSQPDPSAMLDIKSTSKGVLLPRITYEQRNTIVNPSEGLMVFCTNCGTNGALSLYSNGGWRTFSPCDNNSPTAGSHVASPTQIVWNWLAVSGATGYKWNTVNNYNSSTDMGVNTTKLESGLACNTQYTRYVWAYNACGTSSQTTLTKTTLSNPTAPISGTHVPSSSQIVWNWNSSEGASGYKWNTTNNYSTAIDLSGSLTKTETGLSCNTPYTRYIWAYNVCGISTTTVINQTTSINPISPNSGVHVPSLTQIVWKWIAVSGAVGYKWNNTNDYNSAIDMSTSLLLVENGLLCGTNYTRYVWAYNSCGNSISTTLTQNTLACHTIPTVVTTTITNIYQTTATSGGDVTSDGGAAVTERGVCWSTVTNPTTSSSHTSNGTGTGSFVSNLTGLVQNTIYFVRAYAINNIGTSYGNELSFTTSFAPYSAQVLIVGGGGGSNAMEYDHEAAGGGGGGKVQYQSSFSISSINPIVAIIGNGGSPGAILNSGAGSSSVFGSITANGGSGGGAMNGGNSGSGMIGGTSFINLGGGGGGGDSGNGSTPTGSNGGNGGNGTTSSISGSTSAYGGGGGGSGVALGYGGSGGSGGGGSAYADGVVNSGGGAGGGSYGGSFTGYTGGSGIIIVRYTSNIQRGTGGTVTTIGGDFIHTFTSSGVFTPN